MERQNIIFILIGTIISGISGYKLYNYISKTYEDRHKFKKRDENDDGSTIDKCH